jgi:hypothetical protein
MEAFGGVGVNATTDEAAQTMEEAVRSMEADLIECRHRQKRPAPRRPDHQPEPQRKKK